MVPRAPSSRPPHDRGDPPRRDLTQRVVAEAEALRRAIEGLSVSYRDGLEPSAGDLDSAMEAARSLQLHADALRTAGPGAVPIDRALSARDAVDRTRAAAIDLSAHLRTG